MAGQPVTDEMQQQYQQLMGVLSLNTELTNFMLAEHRLNQLMSDIFKILADAVQMDLGFGA